MTGLCARVTVVCVLALADGTIAVGSNACATPVATCPRLPGEGYEKCRSICGQQGHAEVQALRNCAGRSSVGARAFLIGHDHYCRECQRALFGAGVFSLSIIASTIK
jgi:hypothetical protein